MKKRLLLVVMLTCVGCEREPATEVERLAAEVDKIAANAPTPPQAPDVNVQVTGSFGVNGARPTADGEKLAEADSAAVAELNIVAKFRVETAFAERDVDAGESVLVTFGGPGETDGLLLTVRYQRAVKSHKIPPASNGPELVANLDHTLDRILDELGVARKTPGQ